MHMQSEFPQRNMTEIPDNAEYTSRINSHAARSVRVAHLASGCTRPVDLHYFWSVPS